MKKLFFCLLRKYSTTEQERILIQSILHKQVSDTYREQTGYGNVKNAAIEFLAGNQTALRMSEIHLHDILFSAIKEFKQSFRPKEDIQITLKK